MSSFSTAGAAGNGHRNDDDAPLSPLASNHPSVADSLSQALQELKISASSTKGQDLLSAALQNGSTDIEYQQSVHLCETTWEDVDALNDDINEAAELLSQLAKEYDECKEYVELVSPDRINPPSSPSGNSNS